VDFPSELCTCFFIFILSLLSFLFLSLLPCTVLRSALPRCKPLKLSQICSFVSNKSIFFSPPNLLLICYLFQFDHVDLLLFESDILWASDIFVISQSRHKIIFTCTRLTNKDRLCRVDLTLPWCLSVNTWPL
jgi:hypothetical protein